jgi:CheY-like chemotaxis protein
VRVINPLLSYPALLAYFSGADNYTWVYFRNGKRKLVAKPLAYFEKQLPGFVRIHKTALINPAFVADIEPPPRPKMAGAVRLQDDTLLPVSRRRWAAVLTTLQTAIPTGLAMPVVTAVLPTDPPSVAPPAPPIRIEAILTGDALLLTEQCLNRMGVNYRLQATGVAADLPRILRQTPDGEWPALILMDARTDRAGCLLCLETIKGDPRLRIIPVIWLNAAADSADQAYRLDANSVVSVSAEPCAFVRVLSQLFHYWLFIVQFPG